MSAVTFRTATRDDVETVVRLLAADSISTGRDAWTPELAGAYYAAFDRMTAQGGNRVLVAELDRRIVGCLQLTILQGLSRRGVPRAQVEMVRVDESLRGRGIGSALLRHAMEEARAEGATMMQLTTQVVRADAQRFYKRLGFAATHVGMKVALDAPGAAS
ncbi:GNAT family N-acetyltransferase [Azospirillum sp. TSO22-1]|uniref:GNAT family N-acetyltransferase n=1 Tax=Azospirillum sp. TSO22-1 TaxID=716789 RepID=UPI000D65BCAE|nr:GNAT family N-acetyltransferase [Azospirillum sp. TSO22-1]